MKTPRIFPTARSGLKALTLLSTLTLCNAYAQDSATENALRIATGPSTGVYTQMFADIQKTCGKVVPLTQVSSKGGPDNLHLLSSSEADLGFVQVDLMHKMGKDGDQNIQELQAVMSLHSNLLHVLTLRTGSLVNQRYLLGTPIPKTGEVKVITKFSDLKGMTIAAVGSAQILSHTLEQQLAYGMTFVKADSDDQAIAMLNSNQVQAIMTTGGWPYQPISRHGPESGLQLAEYNLTPSAPLRTVKRNYTKLDAYNWPFLSSTNLLLTRPFKPDGERGKMVAALQRCIFTHLDELREGRYQAAWKEIRDPSDTLGIAGFGNGSEKLAKAPRGTSIKQQ